MPPTPDERTARLQLALLIEPGHPTTGVLVRRLGAAETLRLVRAEHPAIPADLGAEWFAAWRRHLRNPDATPTLADALRGCDQRGIAITAPGDPAWPTGLAALGATAPLVLFSHGDVGLLTRPLHAKVAIVGSRAATSYGEHVAQRTAADLSAHGDTIVSGGAYGIDVAAHRGALTGPGGTVAVLAGGLDRYYPAGNTTLLSEVARHGAVVSEAPPGTAPSRARFLQRNRIIAATSGLTVIVEAAHRSGSLDTAHRAHHLGRAVAAFPGPVTSVASAGAHQAIAAGIARLVTDADDIRRLLDPTPAGPIAQALPRLDRIASDHRTSLHDFAVSRRPTRPGEQTPRPGR
ncbi:MAG TPA: DNA-protecting protein DprA [Micrococcales bacterium]|nr:DNA-protecting protein DprA [Micrococcales bacterium]